jgi:hypothetical protein
MPAAPDEIRRSNARYAASGAGGPVRYTDISRRSRFHVSRAARSCGGAPDLTAASLVEQPGGEPYAERSHSDEEQDIPGDPPSSAFRLFFQE